METPGLRGEKLEALLEGPSLGSGSSGVSDVVGVRERKSPRERGTKDRGSDPFPRPGNGIPRHSTVSRRKVTDDRRVRRRPIGLRPRPVSVSRGVRPSTTTRDPHSVSIGVWWRG